MQLKKDGGDSLQPRRILFLFCLDTCSCNVFYLQSKKYFTAFLSLIFALLFIGCANNEKPLFETVLASETGITFKNTIINSDTLTVLDFEYLYNGGGVGIGDINNDGLQDIYFTGNMTSGKLFLNKGNWKFEDITEKAGVSTSVWVNGVSMVDINQDGYKDIFLCVAGTRNTPAAKKKNLLFINNGNQTFTESAASYGLQGTDHNIQSAFLDYDRDGDLDVYLLRNAFVEYSRNRARPKSVKGESVTTHQLYRNNGNNTFTNVSAEAGILIEGFGLGVQVCDINDDQWPDIFVSNDFITNDLLYVNNGNGTFTNHASQYLKHQTYNAMGNDVADINNDGLVDIVEVDMLPPDNLRWKVTIMGNNYDEFQNTIAYGYEPQYIRNTLQLNNGNGSFSEIGYLAGIEATDWSWAPLLADFDNDRLKDLFITTGYRQDITNLDFIKFSDLASRMGTQEANKKERMDMLTKIPGIKVHNYIYKNNGDLTFSDQSDAWGFTHASYSNGAAYADLDNDGDLDLMINNIDEEATLLRNNASNLVNGRFLRFAFSGASLNREGFGTKVYVRHNGHMQYQFFTPFRGFLSTVEPLLHFGMDTLQSIDSVEIIWPDGKYQLLQNVKTNQTIVLKYSDGAPAIFQENTDNKVLPFERIPVDGGLNFKHTENDFVDFKIQPLLPHMHSRNGPGLAVGDVNGDTLEDIYIGGATGMQGGLFFQLPGNTFRKVNISKSDSLADDMGVLFFDADKDQDLDLFVVSGGSEHVKGSVLYKDHLYVNNGKGYFSEAMDAIPDIRESGSTVNAADYDHDGDMDLFVGGRIIPGEYPLPANSHILRNDSRTNDPLFTDVTDQVCPELKNIGLVTSALWTDVDNDGWIDLMMVGEFMPVTLYRNNKGKTFSHFAADQFEHTSGWWNSLASADFDKDGDIDYLAGNLGLNSRYEGTGKEPLCIYAHDFDKTGSIDPVMTLYIQGEKQIAHSWDDMVKQMNAFRMRFRTYQPYAEASFEESFLASEIDAAYKVCSDWFQSSYIENSGNGKFYVKPLPIEAQISPVFGMLPGDYDQDGNEDVLLVGNSYATEVSSGRSDASIGLLLQGDGQGNFISQSVLNTGFVVDKNAKGLARLQMGDGSAVIVASVNDDKVIGHSISLQNKELLHPEPNDAYAMIRLKNGKQFKHEFYHGSTYLSQSSRSLPIPVEVESVTIFDFSGQMRNHVLQNDAAH